MIPDFLKHVRQTGLSTQGSSTPVSFSGYRESLRLIVETGARKIRGNVINEQKANVAAQINALIPAIIFSVGTTVFDPPA
jgi:hypothetical protein